MSVLEFDCCEHCEHDDTSGDGYDPETDTHDEPCPYGCDGNVEFKEPGQ